MAELGTDLLNRHIPLMNSVEAAVEVEPGHEASLIPKRHAQCEAEAHRHELPRDAERFGLGLEDDSNLSWAKLIASPLITTGFAEGAARTRALGMYGATASIGFVSGLVLGGVLVERGRDAGSVDLLPAGAARLAADDGTGHGPTRRGRVRSPWSAAFSSLIAFGVDAVVVVLPYIFGSGMAALIVFLIGHLIGHSVS